VPLKLDKTGKNCKINVDCDNDALLSKIHITCGDNCRISIGNPVAINSGIQIHMASNCSLTIGDGLASNGWLKLFMHEPGVSISIGRDCLFAICEFWTSDVHSVVDKETGLRLNFAKSIQLGDRVWIAENALILKGVAIGSESIVAARAVVTKDVPPNCCVAGNPARIVKRNVTWDFRMLQPGERLP